MKCNVFQMTAVSGIVEVLLIYVLVSCGSVMSENYPKPSKTGTVRDLDSTGYASKQVVR